MGSLLLGVSSFTILELSIVLSIAQLLCAPLDFIGLRRLRLFITGIYANSLGHSIVFWFEWTSNDDSGAAEQVRACSVLTD